MASAASLPTLSGFQKLSLLFGLQAAYNYMLSCVYNAMPDGGNLSIVSRFS